MRYNAGSEVYTQSLAHALAGTHEVHVFTRQENSFLPEYALVHERDPLDARIALYIVNMARTRDRYRHLEVDNIFCDTLDRVKPDLVHIQHLNHLSTSLVFAAHERNIPIIFTLHDYWLMCPRGQFIQFYPQNASDMWSVCDGQHDLKCATRCYQRYFSGAPDETDHDVAYWSTWIGRRMNHVRDICAQIDYFVAPSNYLLTRFRDEFGIPAERLVYLDYGFHVDRLNNRRRVPGEPFTFGYIGTHIPAKGVNHLIEAFRAVPGEVQLRIWGRPRGSETTALQQQVNALPSEQQARVIWMGEYTNQNIIESVFNWCDTIVVPSIWAENSPLVIHEALQARVPVITADYGGMREYVQHDVNGALFQHRSTTDLANQMLRLASDPKFAAQLGRRGYIQSPDGNIPSMELHVQAVEQLYYRAIQQHTKVCEHEQFC